MQSIDDLAREHKWLVIRPGVAYSKGLTPYSEIFLWKEANGTWTVWRGNWIQGNSNPVSEKTLFAGGTFEQAFRRANKYVSWRKGKEVR